MGRAARAKRVREQRIKLPEADFFRLVAKLRTLEVLRLEAQAKAARLAATMVERDLKAAAADGKALFDALAKRHGFDPTLPCKFDEATCELVFEAS